MSDSPRQPAPWIRMLRRHWAWVAVVLIILFVGAIRWRLREMPLERDEGEYAYAGQLLLQGVPPYKLAYNMKLPGTYLAYAGILAIFGQTPSGIHIGLLLVNAASIVLLFLLGRRMLDPVAGVASAGCFALMSLSPSVLGLAAHATHFVVLPALAGLLVLLNGIQQRKRLLLFASGLLFGTALLMKQHGALFAVCGGIYLAWTLMNRKPVRLRRLVEPLAWFAAGVILPYLAMAGLLAAMGVLRDFIFWTFTYARKYVSQIPAGEAPAYLRFTMGGLWSDNPFFWILAALAAIVMWWETRLEGWRFLLTLFLICSIAAVSAGFYFREHYFVLLLPALALLAGIGISRSIYLLKHDRTIELFAAVAMLLLLLLGVGNSFVAFGGLWFGLTPIEATNRIYLTTLFTETMKAGEYIKSKTDRNARVAVIGSEPEIYFYARRRSATGYIYTYPLLEAHEFAARMQDSMIREIEQGQPEYLVYVNDDNSWLKRDSSPRAIFNWWESYWVKNYDLEQTIPISVHVDLLEVPGTEERVQNADQGSRFLLVLKRKDHPSTESATANN